MPFLLLPLGSSKINDTYSMINLEKLQAYQKLDGDADMWSRMNNYRGNSATEKAEAAKREREVYQDWQLIDEMIQGQLLIFRELAAEDYKQKIHAKFIEFTSDDETRRTILKIMQEKFGVKPN
jgi:hypothetical protein